MRPDIAALTGAYGHPWSHAPAFDHRRGAMDQYR